MVENMRRKLVFGVLAVALSLSGCVSEPPATDAQLSALFAQDTPRWEKLNAEYQGCVSDWFLLHSGEDCYFDAKELVASAKGVLAEYETLNVPADLSVDGDRTIAALQRVIEGDIASACGSGTLPDAELSACGEAIPAWVGSLDALVRQLDRW